MGWCVLCLNSFGSIWLNRLQLFYRAFLMIKLETLPYPSEPIDAMRIKNERMMLCETLCVSLSLFLFFFLFSFFVSFLSLPFLLVSFFLSPLFLSLSLTFCLWQRHANPTRLGTVSDTQWGKDILQQKVALLEIPQGALGLLGTASVLLAVPVSFPSYPSLFPSCSSVVILHCPTSKAPAIAEASFVPCVSSIKSSMITTYHQHAEGLKTSKPKHTQHMKKDHARGASAQRCCARNG